MKDLTIFASNFKPERGGVAEYTYQLANGLHEVGRLNRVVTTVPQDSECSYRFDVVEMSEKRKLGERLGDSNLITRKLNSFRYLFKQNLLSYRTALSLFRERWGRHIIFTSLYRNTSKYILSKCIKMGLKFSVVFHGKDLIMIKDQNPYFLDKVCKKASLLIFNSDATRELFGQIQTRREKQYYILHPGINPSQFNSAEETVTFTLERRYDTNLQVKTVILSLARLVKRKGIDIALRALAPILDGSDQYRYIIAGDGPEYEALKSEVEALGLCNKVTLTGEVTDAEKYGLLRASSLFVMPNHTRDGSDYEGFGISFIEASYFENVVIGGRSGGAVEAIAEGESGFLLDFEREGAEEELRALTRDVLNDPDRVEKIARRGRRHVLERFQAPELVADFARSFDEMVDS
jgi:glycosyltransferase involved in cell wall biosynthesis